MIGCWINDVDRPEEIEKAANADLFSLSMRDAMRMCVAAARFKEETEGGSVGALAFSKLNRSFGAASSADVLQKLEAK
jgi:hypothetical protein